MQSDFEKDIKDSHAFIKKVGSLSIGDTISMLDEQALMKIVFEYYKTKRWFIIMAGWKTPVEFLERIEYKHYPPNTKQGLGFQMVIMPHYAMTLIFAHKSLMSYDDLNAVMREFNAKGPLMNEQHDLIVMFPTEHAETDEWIRKIEISKVYGKRVDNKIHFEVTTQNLGVVKEIGMYERFSKIQDAIRNYIAEHDHS